MDDKIILVVGLIGVMIFVGACIAFNPFKKLLKFIKGNINKMSEKEAQLNELSLVDREDSLSGKLDIYNGKKAFFLVRELNEARDILKETGRTAEYGITFTSCFIFAFVGAAIGWAIHNYIAMFILMAGMFLVPLWRLKLYRNKYKKYRMLMLEGATSMITASYIRSNDIVKSVEENLERISPIIAPFFKRFIAETKVTPSVKACIKDLKDEINDSIFKEWCDTLLRVLDNSEMKESLLPICQKYSAVHIVQEEIDIEVAGAIMEYAVMMGMCVGAYLIIWIMNKDWFAYFSTLPGNIVVAFTLVVLFFSIAKLIAVSQTVEYRA